MPEKLKKAYKKCMQGSWAEKVAQKAGKSKDQICRGWAVNVTGEKWDVSQEDAKFHYQLNVEDAELSNGELVFSGISATEDYVPRAVLEKYHTSKIGKKIVFDHFHPVCDKFEDKVFPVFGEILNSTLEEDENGKLINRIKGKIYGFSDAHKALQKLVKKGELLGLSDHFIIYKDKKGNMIHAHFEETSITPAPKCKVCKISSIGDSMPNEEKKEEVIETKLSTTELEDTIVEMNELILSQKQKIEELEKTISEKQVIEQELSKTREELEKSKDMVKFLTEKKPLLDQLEVILGAKYSNSPELKKHYEAFTKEQLEFEVKRLSEEKKEVKAVPIEEKPTPPKAVSEEEMLSRLTQEVNELFPEHKKLIQNIKELY